MHVWLPILKSCSSATSSCRRSRSKTTGRVAVRSVASVRAVNAMSLKQDMVQFRRLQWLLIYRRFVKAIGRPRAMPSSTGLMKPAAAPSCPPGTRARLVLCKRQRACQAISARRSVLPHCSAPRRQRLRRLKRLRKGLDLVSRSPPCSAAQCGEDRAKPPRILAFGLMTGYKIPTRRPKCGAWARPPHSALDLTPKSQTPPVCCSACLHPNCAIARRSRCGSSLGAGSGRS